MINVKIGEVWLSDEIGEGGFEILKKLNFIITIRYKIPTFLLVFEFWPEAEILGIFSIEIFPTSQIHLMP